MAVEHADSSAFQGVPGVHRVIVIAGEQNSAAGREVHRIDAEDDAALSVAGNLTICSKVKQTTLREKEIESSLVFRSIKQCLVGNSFL